MEPQRQLHEQFCQIWGFTAAAKAAAAAGATLRALANAMQPVIIYMAGELADLLQAGAEAESATYAAREKVMKSDVQSRA